MELAPSPATRAVTVPVTDTRGVASVPPALAHHLQLLRMDPNGGGCIVESDGKGREYARQHLPRLQAEIARACSRVVAEASPNPVADVGYILCGAQPPAALDADVSRKCTKRAYCDQWLHTIESALCGALAATIRAAPADPVIFLGKLLIGKSFNPSSTSRPSLVTSRSSTRGFLAARWRSSFVKGDPRRQIVEYFKPGDARGPYGYLRALGTRPGTGPSSCFFSVWRPTSLTAMRMMYDGTAIGKGLNVKGKSAKRGKLSGFVPFVQISTRAHVPLVGTLPADARLCIYFQTKEAREEAVAELEKVRSPCSRSRDEQTRRCRHLSCSAVTEALLLALGVCGGRAGHKIHRWAQLLQRGAGVALAIPSSGRLLAGPGGDCGAECARTSRTLHTLHTRGRGGAGGAECARTLHTLHTFSRYIHDAGPGGDGGAECVRKAAARWPQEVRVGAERQRSRRGATARDVGDGEPFD